MDCMTVSNSTLGKTVVKSDVEPVKQEDGKFENVIAELMSMICNNASIVYDDNSSAERSIELNLDMNNDEIVDLSCSLQNNHVDLLADMQNVDDMVKDIKPGLEPGLNPIRESSSPSVYENMMTIINTLNNNAIKIVHRQSDNIVDVDQHQETASVEIPNLDNFNRSEIVEPLEFLKMDDAIDMSDVVGKEEKGLQVQDLQVQDLQVQDLHAQSLQVQDLQVQEDIFLQDVVLKNKDGAKITEGALDLDVVEDITSFKNVNKDGAEVNVEKETSIFEDNNSGESNITKIEADVQDSQDHYQFNYFSNSDAQIDYSTASEQVSESNQVEPYTFDVIDSMSNSIVDSAKEFSKDGTYKLSISLKPEFLGDLDVTVISENNKIIASIKASNEDVLEALDSKSSYIQEVLKSQGVDVKEIILINNNSGLEAGFNANEMNYFSRNDNRNGNEQQYKESYFSDFNSSKDDLNKNENTAQVIKYGRVNYLI